MLSFKILGFYFNFYIFLNMPNFFKIFKKIIFLLNNGFDRYLNKRKKHNFSILFSLRSVLLSLPVRVRYDNNQYFFWDYNNKKLN